MYGKSLEHFIHPDAAQKEPCRHRRSIDWVKPIRTHDQPANRSQRTAKPGNSGQQNSRRCDKEQISFAVEITFHQSKWNRKRADGEESSDRFPPTDPREQRQYPHGKTDAVKKTNVDLGGQEQ